MSKWIDKSLFENFVNEKESEKEKNTSGVRRMEKVWPTPEAGTEDKPKVYEGRFLPDVKGKFTKQYFYHMFKMGDKWQFVLCPKTHDFENYCPFCSAVNKLYTGSKADKEAAPQYKRKSKHVANWFIVNDPRDVSINDEEKKSTGKIKLYEFPDKVDSKLKTEILDKKEGLQASIFDPGPDGHNFILRVKQTKKDAKGNQYPDYSDSSFSRKSSPLGSDAEIRKIMESRYSIDDYIKELEMTPEEMEKILKNEMLWSESIEAEFNKYYHGKGNTVVLTKNDDIDTDEESSDSDVPDFDDLTDEDIMKDLDNM